MLLPLFLQQLLVPLTPAMLVNTAVDREVKNCTDSLRIFIGEIRWDFNNSADQLYVTVPPVSDQLADRVKTDCKTDSFTLELWGAIQKPLKNRHEGFGTEPYFSEFQNCKNLDPDLLWKHGESMRISTTLGNELLFYHILGKEYVMRLCPCSPHCSCEALAVCSPLLVPQSGPPVSVFPWCQADQSSPPPMILAPVIQHCPARVKVSGTLPSCTPVREYDQVEVVLVPVNHNQVPDCSRPPYDGETKVSEMVPLNTVNKTHGTFNAEISNISFDTYYCLRVQLGGCFV